VSLHNSKVVLFFFYIKCLRWDQLSEEGNEANIVSLGTEKIIDYTYFNHSWRSQFVGILRIYAAMLSTPVNFPENSLFQPQQAWNWLSKAIELPGVSRWSWIAIYNFLKVLFGYCFLNTSQMTHHRLEWMDKNRLLVLMNRIKEKLDHFRENDPDTHRLMLFLARTDPPSKAAKLLDSME
jgi:hypothetical protein